jgi:uncharacterized protein (TIGR01370 family)
MGFLSNLIYLGVIFSLFGLILILGVLDKSINLPLNFQILNSSNTSISNADQSTQELDQSTEGLGLKENETTINNQSEVLNQSSEVINLTVMNESNQINIANKTNTTIDEMINNSINNTNQSNFIPKNMSKNTNLSNQNTNFVNYSALNVTEPINLSTNESKESIKEALNFTDYYNLSISLQNANTFANYYQIYTDQDLERLRKFDIVIIEPYSVPNKEFISNLKSSGTLVFAYISIGEASNTRRYWYDWQPTELTPDSQDINRTIINAKDSVILKRDEAWPGSYFVNASNQKWHDIILNQEIPYILWLGGNHYDGLFLDVIDVVDVYDNYKNGDKMKKGMIDLVKEIRAKYPNLKLIANRGFSIFENISDYIDAVEFEEMTCAYGDSPDNLNYGKYYLYIENGTRTNQEDLDYIFDKIKSHPIPVLVLDHVETNPLDEKSAAECYTQALRVANETGLKIIWYANSVEEDLPLWSFLKLKN